MHNISVRNKNKGCLVVVKRPSDETRKYTSDDFGPSVYRTIGILALEEMFFRPSKAEKKKSWSKQSSVFSPESRKPKHILNEEVIRKRNKPKWLDWKCASSLV